jgi:ubiquinone/menaquinone biosynthesis C-methylase UbiE
MSAPDSDRLRAEVLEGWERMAARWGEAADEMRGPWMPVSSWLIDALELQPGQRVLELAAGPGDTGFLAAELIAPGGLLICSDAAQAMVEVARKRAARLRITNVEFQQLSLEWIDLPAADVDAVLCRWGLMFAIDPGAALQEMRRVTRPGGRVALAVWDEPQRNPWMTIPRQALIEAGHLEAPDPSLPGPFTLSEPGHLHALLDAAGFTEVVLDVVDIERRFPDAERYLASTVAISSVVAERWPGLSDAQRAAVVARVAELAQPFTSADGLALPGRTLVASASA